MHQSVSLFRVCMSWKIYKRFKSLLVYDPKPILEVVVEVVDILIINMCWFGKSFIFLVSACHLC